MQYSGPGVWGKKRCSLFSVYFMEISLFRIFKISSVVCFDNFFFQELVRFIKDLKFLFVQICFYLNKKQQKKEEWVEKEKTCLPQPEREKPFYPAQAHKPDGQRFREKKVLSEEFGKENAMI